MGRKSTEKSKLKKLKRKEETAKLAQKIALINAANLQEDPMAMLLPFKKFERNGLKLELNCWRVKNMDAKLIDWAFQLTKTNMMRLYENSEWGWSDKLKKEEMTHDNSWFLVATDASSVAKDSGKKKNSSNVIVKDTANNSITSNVPQQPIKHDSVSTTNTVSTCVQEQAINVDNARTSIFIDQSVHSMSLDDSSTVAVGDLKSYSKPVAMAHFRFDLENDEEVLYCYEIQLTPEVRRKGLGKFLMQILELMAFKSEMKKVMLTTFKINRSAQEFFKKLRYSLDETSPGEDEDGEPCSYEIYSKPIGLKSNSISSHHNNGHTHVHGACCHH